MSQVLLAFVALLLFVLSANSSFCHYWLGWIFMDFDLGSGSHITALDFDILSGKFSILVGFHEFCRSLRFWSLGGLITHLAIEIAPSKKVNEFFVQTENSSKKLGAIDWVLAGWNCSCKEARLRDASSVLTLPHSRWHLYATDGL